jgi:hypothetical protein|tara:strand:- start:259 stop:426 length:168 start_codon:yes stop_codon:yes gene_type:complete
MNIDLKDSNYSELRAYQIALLSVQVNCNEQLARIKTKLEQVKIDWYGKKESKKDE